jgi:feruloyl esterase
MEVWMPLENWNGKFQMIGNGGWAGAIAYGSMALALNEGYATASTDTGHKGGTAEFALGHPEKVIDFAYRAVHETTLTSKAIVSAFYDRPPRLSYWNGCSTGGRQGLMEAQRYPEDFDGIIAGAPASSTTQLAAWRLNIEAKTLKDRARIVSSAKLALVNKAVLAACDALDGVTDEFLTDPRQCRFDPATLLCRSADGDHCLTAPQLEAVKSGYAPLTTKSGEVIYPGLVPGAEARWVMLTGANPVPGALNDLDMFRYLVHEDPAWDWRTFDVDRDAALADAKVGYMNASNPDLSAFKARGGKLILYHGWNDGGNGGAISPLNSVDYYSNVLSQMGVQQGDWLRLFMVPGMAHCGGGPGTPQINWVAALERWREAGIAPDQLTGSRVNINPRVDMTRPICPYPKVPKYNGVGSTNDAANFVCQTP